MQNTKALDEMEKQVRPSCTVGEWRKITQNIRRVQNIMDQTLNIEELKPDTSVDDVKQQINRLNRSGKTPTKEDVDLMQLSFVWPACHEEVNCLIHRWRNSELEPVVNKATIIRNFASSLTGNVRSKSTEKAFNAVDDVTLKEIYGETASNLEVIGKALEHYFAIGKSTSLRTTAPFVVVMQHLRNQGGEFPNQEDELKALAYLITSTIRGFRAGSSSSYLNQELGALNHPDPWAELEHQALLRNGPTIVEPSRFEYRDGSPAPHHLLVQILQMLPTSKDWITGQPLRQHRKDELVKHRIFPKNETPTIEAYHSVANTVLLHHMTARCLLDRSPSEYMPTITGRNPSILAGQQVPDGPNLHKPENFEEFAKERMEILSIDGIEVVNRIQQGTPPDGIMGRPRSRS